MEEGDASDAALVLPTRLHSAAESSCTAAMYFDGT